MILPLFFALATSVVAVPAPGAPANNVTANNGVVYRTDKAGEATEGFVEIHNTGPADILTGATCPLADTTTLVGPDNKTPVSVPVPADQDVMLTDKTGHLLLLSTHYSVEQDALIPCSLMFQNAGIISVYLNAAPAPARSS